MKGVEGHSTQNNMLRFLLGLSALGLCYGLSIDVMEIESSGSRNPPTKIICQFTKDEIQTAQNRITMTHEGLDLAECMVDTMKCTTASPMYNATIHGDKSELIIKDMDLFYEGNTWACVVGPKSASLKLKYFRAAEEGLLDQLVKKINIFDILVLLVVIAILVIMLILVIRFCCCRRKKRRSKNSTSSDDPESGSCCSCIFRKKEKKTGYDGKRYPTVKTDFTIKDPNHQATHKFKDGVDRKKEAERVCAQVSPETKAAATSILSDYVEARKPLVSTSEESGKKA